MNVRSLPKGYRVCAVMDFTRDKKLLKAMAIYGNAVALITFAAGFLFRMPVWSLWPWLCMLPMVAAYIVLHEAVHGVLMYALSRVRPKFGFKLCYAYAGSDVWFDRRSHVVIALAPLIVWGAVLAWLCAALPAAWFWPLWIVQVSNVSGAVGDIYCAAKLLRMKGDLLIRDTGTRMLVARNSIVKEETPL